MKIEDLHYDVSNNVVDEKIWNKEKWQKEHPMDYFLASSILYEVPKAEYVYKLFETVYQVTRLYLPDVIYKYYSFSTDEKLNEQKLRTLGEAKIYMAEISSFNDPFDGKAFFYNADLLKDIELLKEYDGKLIDDFSSLIRGTSFTSAGIQSMPMWAHYSNNHAGFCVSYEVGTNDELKMSLFPVQYTDQRLDVTSLIKKMALEVSEVVQHALDNNEKELVLKDARAIYVALLMFNVKQASWSYEKEFRLSVPAKDKYISAKPKEIFIGAKCDKKHEEALSEIGDYFDIPVYRMLFSEIEDKYELKRKRIV